MKKLKTIFALSLFLIPAPKESVSAESEGLPCPPYLNAALPAGERAEDLCRRMTLQEKVSLMMNMSPAIRRLGVPQWQWWGEALHGAARNGIATVFPSCIGMAASFDDSLLLSVYTAVGDEVRAKNNELHRQGREEGTYQGLSVWTPNINIFRDPRWGRGQETYGEDPYLTGVMGCAVVRGLQEAPPEGSRRPYKLFACAKHFAVHSGPEKTRHRLNIDNLSERDLYETYLPAFKTVVEDGGVKEVMCAYQRFNGDPCCGSSALLGHILRGEWSFRGLVVSDCGAISDFFKKGAHHVDSTREEAAARGVLAGTDVECGGDYRELPLAVEKGLISERQIDSSVVRLLTGRFSLGDMTPDSLVCWRQLDSSVIASKEHHALALDMARETIVLLKNDGILPLDKVKDRGKIMVIGPNATDSTMLWGIYAGQPRHTTTILEGIERSVGGKVPYTQGCAVTALTENEDLFPYITDGGARGMTGQFWNNEEMEGQPVYEGHYAGKLNFDNGGNTVFAPNVRLNAFSARFRGALTAPADAVMTIALQADDGTRVIINGDTIHSRWRNDRLRERDAVFSIKKGKRYDIQIDYKDHADAATLRCDIYLRVAVTPQDIVAKARDAEIIIFVGGISPALEREEAKVREEGFDDGDRTSIELPEAQRRLLRALHEAGKRVILVNCSGSAVALTPETETCEAILQAWYGGEEGGQAVSDVLFGDYNPSGRLPVTFYADDAQLVSDFENYNMRGHTYRFLLDGQKVLFPFGYGLSYTTLSYGKVRTDYATLKEGETLLLRVPLTNSGSRDATETVQVYLRRPGDSGGPVKTLRAFRRVSVPAGAAVTASLALPYSRFEWWDPSTNTMRPLPGAYDILVGSSADDGSLQRLTVTLE